MIKELIKRTIFYEYYKKWRIYRERNRVLKCYSPKGCIFDENSFFDSKCEFEGKNHLAKGVTLSNVKLGFGTYIEENTKLNNTVIGRYCSIAPHVVNIVGTHPSRQFVSTHPAFYSASLYRGYTYSKRQKFDEYKYAKGDISNIIGNDVWIGENVSILQGVSIGDGAIVGANALVTQDVPPYAIVVGVPARIVRYRFDQEEIELLQEFKWWDRDENWIIEHCDDFEDICMFMRLMDK